VRERESVCVCVCCCCLFWGAWFLSHPLEDVHGDFNDGDGETPTIKKKMNSLPQDPSIDLIWADLWWDAQFRLVGVFTNQKENRKGKKTTCGQG